MAWNEARRHRRHDRPGPARAGGSSRSMVRGGSRATQPPNPTQAVTVREHRC